MEKPTPSRERSRGEVLLPLFDGPGGSTFLGRMLDGVDAGRPVLLREVSASEAIGLELTLRSARQVTHPSVAKALALTTVRDAMYVASEYVDGITIYELLHMLEREGVGLEARIATRIVADALTAADQIGGLLRGKASPRCIFIDTVWIASYGGTLISEPFVADFVQRGAFKAELVPGPRGEKSLAALDAYAALELLYRLVLGRANGPVLPELTAARLPKELLRLMDGRESWTKRADLAKVLRRFPTRLFASEGSVAAMIAKWATPMLEMRREVAMPSSRASEDDATASFTRPTLPMVGAGDSAISNVAVSPTRPTTGPRVRLRARFNKKLHAQSQAEEARLAEDVHDRTSESLEETKNLRRSALAEAEISAERAVLEATFEPEADDDQEVTIAFRPSRILKPRPVETGDASSVPSSRGMALGGSVDAGAGVELRARAKGPRPLVFLVVLLILASLALMVWGLAPLLVRM